MRGTSGLATDALPEVVLIVSVNQCTLLRYVRLVARMLAAVVCHARRAAQHHTMTVVETHALRVPAHVMGIHVVHVRRFAHSAALQYNILVQITAVLMTAVQIVGRVIIV